MTCRAISALSAAALLLTVTPLPAQPTSQVKIVAEGKTFELKHVVAARYAAESEPAEIRLLFASAAPAGLVLADGLGESPMRALMEWAETSKASAVLVTFKEGDEVNYSVSTFNVGANNYSGGGHSSGGETRGVFRKLDLGKAAVAGELKHEAGSAMLSGSFKTMVTTAAAAPAITGAKVAASPQAETLLAFARAMGKMDFAAAQPYAAEDVQAQMKEAKEFMGEDGLKKMIKERFGDPKVLQAMLKHPDVTLVEAGDRARISLTKKTKDKDGETSETESFTFMKVDGKWKMTM